MARSPAKARARAASKEIDFFLCSRQRSGLSADWKIMGEKTMETIEDIVREMREFATRHWMHDEGLNIGRFADRIEAATKRKNCHEDSD